MVGFGRIERQIGRGVDSAQEEPRAMLARDEHAVLALPAESGRLRQRFFHHRGGIDEDLHVGSGTGREQPCHALELALDDVVIIATAGIE